MIEIFAHRAIITSEENSLSAIKECIQNNFSIELDVRCNDSIVYLSHDETESSDLLEDACPLFKNSNFQIALHIKEFDAILPTVKLIKKFSLQNTCFIFMTDYDFDKILSVVENQIRVAFYSNTTPKIKNSEIFWCDEMKNSWYDEFLIKDLVSQNKNIIAMSLELLQQSNFQKIEQEWGRLIKLGFSGICTNYPSELAQFIGDVK